MKCGHDDCFSCPYPDCIIDDQAAMCRAYYKTNKERIKAHKHDYYMANREHRLEWQKRYNEEHKAERQAANKRKWATMTEEERNKQRERNRQYYWRKKARIAAEMMAARGECNG